MDIQAKKDRRQTYAIHEDMVIRVVTDNKSFDELEQEWEELTGEADCRIFQTYQWNRIWWKHFGNDGDLRIMLFYQRTGLVGIAPFFLDTVRLFGKNLYSGLRLIGSNVTQCRRGNLIGLIPYTDYLGFIIKPGFESNVYDRFCRYIVDIKNKPDEIILDSIPADRTEANRLPQVVSEAGCDVSVTNTHKSFRVFLPPDWEDYLMSVSKDTRSHSRRALKKIYNSKQQLYSLAEPAGREEAAAFFDEMVNMHQDRWNRLGSLGTFAEKENYQFQKEVALRLFESGRLQIKKLTSIQEQNKSAAIDVNYLFKNVVYGAHCAVDDTSEYYRKGPGTVLLCAALKEISENGLNCFDFLRGSEGYKQSYSNDDTDILRITIKQPGKQGGIIARFAKAFMAMKRKISREWVHIRVLGSGTSLFGGLRAYAALLRYRFSQKFGKRNRK